MPNLFVEPLFWTAVLGFGAIAATLAAPKIGGRGKVTFLVDRVTRIRVSQPHDAVTVLYAVNGQQIEDDIYVAEFEFRNVGAKDITSAAFQKPITVALPEGVNILSTNCSPDTPCNTSISSAGSSLDLSWDILKRKEVAAVSCIFSARRDTPPLPRSIKPVCRLIDVDLVDASRFNAFRFAANLVIVLVLAGVVAAFSYHKSSLGMSNARISVDGIPRPIVFGETFDQFLECEPKENVWTFRSCKKVEPASLDFSTTTFEKVPVGAAFETVAFVTVILAFYCIPIALIFTGRRFAREQILRFVSFPRKERIGDKQKPSGNA